jgi:hypothetical protein
VLNNAVRLRAMPLKIVVAEDGFFVSQNSIVFTRERALASPQIGCITLHSDIVIKWNKWPAASNNNLEF